MSNARNLARAAAVAGGLAPTGVVLPFAGASAPTGWLLCAGQAVSRTTYSDLFAVISTAHGAGDGSTTFNLPDYRGRTPAGLDNMGGTAANRLQVSLTGTTTAASAVVTALSSTAGLAVGMSVFGATIPSGATIASIDSATQVTLASGTGVTAGTASALRFGFLDAQVIGSAGGSHVHTLTTAQIPAHQHTLAARTDRNTAAGGSDNVPVQSAGGSAYTSNAAGGGQAHANLPPTLLTNYIIKT